MRPLLRPLLVVLPLLAACRALPGPAHAPPAAATPGATQVPVPPEPIEVAITIDDLPRHGPALPGREPVDISRSLLEAFARHGIPRVYGFVNGVKVDERPEDRAVLEAWLAAGHPLGNHQWSHQDLNRGDVAGFVEGISRNEPLLRALQPAAPEQTWRTFRYPFLREGTTLADRNVVRAHLAGAGYRVAQVTIDPYDWAYNTAYARCLERGDTAAADALRTQFLAEARAKLRWSVAVAKLLEGRPVRHVLLLHLGLVDADAVEQLLADYERLGVRWVTLEHAQQDPIYARNPDVTYGGAYLFQLAQAKGVTLPPPPSTPMALTEVMCR